MTDKPASLATALAAFQGELPTVKKTKTAVVKTKTGGEYRYSYADLADVSNEVLPLLGKHGLSFSTRPTMTDGRFVLAYVLLHESGDFVAGEYPLPQVGSPQEIGSAITYARRYSLCSMVGVAAEEDDGGQASSHTRTDVRERRADYDPIEQEVLVTGWLAEIADAADEEALKRIGKQLLDAKRKPADEEGALSKASYDHLAVAGGRRKAEFNGAPTGAGSMTQRTRGRMFSLFTAFGLDGDDHKQQRRDISSALLGRPVDSIGALSESDALLVVAGLDKRKREMAVAK